MLIHMRKFLKIFNIRPVKKKVLILLVLLIALDLDRPVYSADCGLRPNLGFSQIQRSEYSNRFNALAFLEDLKKIKVAIFDWDGTISRIREGWEGIMTPLIAAMLSGVILDDNSWNMLIESAEADKERLDDYRTTRTIANLIDERVLDGEAVKYARDMIEETKGDPTPFQFRRAIEHIMDDYKGRKGIEPESYEEVFLDIYSGRLDPLNIGHDIDFSRPFYYFTEFYLKKLEVFFSKRLSLLEKGELHAEDLMVPGAPEFLRYLRSKGIKCYVLTGSAKNSVEREVDLLGLRDIFGKEGVRGFDLKKKIDSKEAVILEIAKREDAKEQEILIAGDGKVEIKAGVENGFTVMALRSMDNKGFFNNEIIAMNPKYVLMNGFHGTNRVLLSSI